MTQLIPYLNFNGNCEEAFNFYKSVFGGEFTYFGRFGDMPGSEQMPENEKSKVMHVALPISENFSIFGSDTSSFSGEASFGNNINLMLSVDTAEEADNIWAALSPDGKVVMPLQNTFWGAYYGQFIDKFGISWMINCELR